MIGLPAWIKHKFKTQSQEFTAIGTVLDETYNLIITSTCDNLKDYQKNIKKYVKSQYMFRFKVPNNANGFNSIEVDGENLLKCPENRIKQIRKIRM